MDCIINYMDNLNMNDIYYGIIYKAVNLVNNKVYIGQTVSSLQRRKKGHLANAKNGEDTYFYNAIRKYGPDSFIWEIIDYTFSLEEQNEKEKYWIKEYKSTNRKYGYNMRDGGEAGGSPNEETKKRMSNAKKGKKMSEEFKQLKRELMLGNTYLLGHIHSEETRKQIGISNTGKRHSEETRKKISETKRRNGNYIFSEETKKRMSESALGKIVSDEAKNNMSKGQKRRRLNMSEEEKIEYGKKVKERWQAKTEESKKDFAERMRLQALECWKKRKAYN